MVETPGIQTETLAQRLARGPLEPQVALALFKRLLKTLAFLHWGGVVYGSLTPNAIAIDSDGQITLAITKAPSDQAYMAPEQIAGDSADARSDVFTLGVVAYEMLTGENPFGARKGVPASEVISRIVNGPSPRIPSALLASLPAYVGPALDIALAKDRDARFPDAESFLDALGDPERVTEAVAAPAPGRPKAAWFRYYALPAALAVVTLVVVLLVLTCAGGSAGLTETTVTSAGTSTSLPTALATDTTSTVTTAEPTTVTTSAPTTTTVLASDTTLSLAPPGATHYEEIAAGLTYTGTWIAGADGAYSGGSLTRADASGATVTASFNGTYLAWIAKKSPAYGQAKVTLDGTATFTVDLYDTGTLYEKKVWDTGVLASGPHTVKIEWTGIKNAAASGTNINLDAVDVIGNLG